MRSAKENRKDSCVGQETGGSPGMRFEVCTALGALACVLCRLENTESLWCPKEFDSGRRGSRCLSGQAMLITGRCGSDWSLIQVVGGSHSHKLADQLL